MPNTNHTASCLAFSAVHTYGTPWVVLQQYHYRCYSCQILTSCSLCAQNHAKRDWSCTYNMYARATSMSSRLSVHHVVLILYYHASGGTRRRVLVLCVEMFSVKTHFDILTLLLFFWMLSVFGAWQDRTWTPYVINVAIVI